MATQKDRIDFNNPAELMNGERRIPIARQGLYNAVKAEVRRRYGTRVTEGELTHETLPFSKADLDQLVARVRGGLTPAQVYEETEKELHRRAPLK